MPKKGKKSGGGKMGGDESLKERCLTEEEMAKQREEAVTQSLRDSLEKDEKNRAANLLMLNVACRASLRQTRDPEFREEVIAFRQMFESQMDGLDSVIKTLVFDLQQKARELTWGRWMHLQHLERVWGLHDKQMMTTQQHWENSMQQLSSEFCSKRKQTFALSQKQSVHLEGEILIMEQQQKELVNEIRMLYTKKILSFNYPFDDEEDKEEKKTVKPCHNEIEINMSIIGGQLEKLTEERKNMELLWHKFVKNKKMLNNNRVRSQAEVQDLRAVHAEVEKKADELFQQLNESRSVSRKQLVALSAQSDKATKKLQDVIAKGERVLRVGEMCQKLESKHKEALSSAADGETSVTEREEPGETSKFSELQKLIGRMETAVLVRDTLKNQKQVLRRENQQLRLQVHQLMDNMSISDDTINGHHTVLQASSIRVLPSPPRPIHKQLVQKNLAAPLK